jgi:hypothetical protein
VQEAVDSACDRWDDTDRAWIAIEWALVRDPLMGVPLFEGGNVRGFVYWGAMSINQPDVDVIYEVQQDAIIIKSAIFTDAKASQAGRG